ncbi:TetR/AcrR family transcriptional regulator [Amycolatopsis acidiphila]|uniref:TetR/AcrR family transcriptional regulator n=1 Tax=Amycolatopsis acidiphila TaxID=715473 RepID=A0A558AMY0_9PSEU|nr:TetR/AcrR family transcriptional regulator [Amycolatopsis acidiphila]TVT25629.1 TetR/AcrR family transcriptional regulator [Amycolatopsis acidiphila]UIJ60384.1 TetR/AcrR family transcriptional regulator [Amycolatopsis acidiphila]GHG90459.1 TetR family transcriptional regulator [Amycolatopsis acidiphila]
MGTRDEILAAASRIMREQGYARATTKEIARAAGYSEATLYKHFADKTEIFLGVLSEQLPALGALLTELAEDAGKGTVRANLVKVARAALDFYVASFPISASLFSTSDLRTKHRDAVRERGVGPRNPQRMLSRYLRAEQRLGRLPRATDVDAMAALLLGACFQQAFLISFEGEPPAPDELDALAKSLVKPLLR